MPKVSVIIPSYNHEEFIAEAIQSVLDQTYQDFEIVVTDDGSSDRTVDVINSFTDPRIKLFCFSQNRGAAVAANNCIRESSGEYIAMLSSDDIFLPQKLEKQVDFLDSHSEVGAVFSYVYVIDEIGNDFPDENHFCKTIFIRENRNRFEWLNYFFFNGNCLCHPSSLVRRTCYDDVGMYCEYYAQIPDFDFWIRLCLRKEIYIIPENLIKFRILNDQKNASAGRADTRIRHSVELARILKRYISSDVLLNFSKIFPGTPTVGPEADICDIATLALEKIDLSPYRYFALDLLFEYLSRESISRAITTDDPYSPTSLVKLTGEIDVFNIISLEVAKSGLERTQAELHQMRTELHQTQTESQQLQTELHQAQTESQQLQTKLHQAQTESQQLKTELHQAQTESQQLKTELHQQLQTELHQAQTESQQLQTELHRLQAESIYFQQVVQAMESSKFWKLRKVWFRLKSIFLPWQLDSATPGHRGHQSESGLSSVMASFVHKAKYNVSFIGRLRRKIYERRQRLGRIADFHELPFLFKKLIHFYTQTESLESSPSPSESSLLKQLQLPDVVDAYEAWLAVNQWNRKAEKSLRERLQSSSLPLPKISIVMPVYNPPLEFLEAAVESVVNQVYGNWELCIADDRSPNSEVRKQLETWKLQDERIRLLLREKNGNISLATNSAASLATGEFILFLDHDDELTPDALGEIALHLANHPETDFLYSDDDKIDTQGRRYAPQFKPDWSPELFLSYMYMSHVCVVRRSVFEQVGGLRAGFEGSQDYDFALRATEVARQIEHLPLILYHWRALEGSTAQSGAAKPESFTAAERALQEALTRRQLQGHVYQPNWARKANCGIFEYEFPDDGPSVGIIIPTKNQLSLVEACINSIAGTTYKNYQVVIIDNESDDPATLDYFDKLNHTVLKISNHDRGFNFAAINNQAAKLTNTDYLLFLNNDTEVIAKNWLSQMMGFAQMPGVGAVGARLLFPNGTIQHAGVIHGINDGLAAPAFKCLPEWDSGYLAYAKVSRNYSAVTAACLLTPRKLFLELNGFDEETFAVAYNDVDYGYRLVEAGYRCVYCPTAELYHKEGASRGFNDNPHELAAFRQKYRSKVDPYYSPYLSLENEHFQIQPRRLVTGTLKPIRTLVFTHNLNWEGAPQCQYELVAHLKVLNIIEPIIHSPVDGPLREKYESCGIEVRVMGHPLSAVHNLESYKNALSELAEWIKSLNVDLVYANTLLTFYAIDVAHTLKISSVWNIRESEPWQNHFQNFSGEIQSKVLSCFRLAYQVVFVANATCKTFLPLRTHHNFAVIQDALYLPRLKQLSEGWSRATARKTLELSDKEVVILLLGTVCERKGQQDLALALSHLKPELHEKVKVFIVGDRPNDYSNQLKQIVAELPSSLREHVSVVPETPDIGRYYEATDLFVFTSRIESFPRVILEAMAYGLPIITTPVFGVLEQVYQGVNAEFYDPGDIKRLASLLEKFIVDQPTREKYGIYSKQVLQSLADFEQMVDAYRKVFQEAYLSSATCG